MSCFLIAIYIGTVPVHCLSYALYVLTFKVMELFIFACC